jgi:hypothetical protein
MKSERPARCLDRLVRPSFIADDRIKAFCLRNGFAIPTDKELIQFPEELRMFDGTGETERLAAGLDLWHFLMTGRRSSSISETNVESSYA